MQLIRVGSMKLEHFDGDSIPKYAILSHTWADNEGMFRDVNSPDAISKVGYEKIDYLCKQARRDKIEYAWIDTACFNKDSSSELSEAINSMFRWYQNAGICYAYLSDVSLEALEAEFPKSRWFTRGWTLQELLAPEQVQFFGKEWKYLGNKTTLVDSISSITGIHPLALRRPAMIPTFSIASRMYWARERITRRLEDMAYCLLGIFGVNMPLLYGEGVKAFKRLQEELIRVSDDESLFACNIISSSDELLAHSPANFAQGKDIEPILAKKNVTPYSMTNKGLYIDLPLLIVGPESDNNYLGILNCHIRNDFSGYIAIPLKATNVRDTFTRRTTYTSKIEKVPEDRCTYAISRTIYIRQSKPRSQTSTCWLRSCSAAQHGYTVEPHFYHFASLWDPETQMSRVDDNWFQNIRCFSFGHPYFNSAFAVLFVLNTVKETSGVSILVKEDSQSLEDWQNRLSWDSIEYLVDELEDNRLLRHDMKLLTEQNQFFCTDRYEITTNISQIEKLRQEIWVLDVSLRGVNS